MPVVDSVLDESHICVCTATVSSSDCACQAGDLSAVVAMSGAASSSDSVLGMFSILMLVSSSTSAAALLDACNSDQCMPQGAMCCQCESCMDRIAAPLVFSGSLIFSDACCNTVHLCTVVQCLRLPHGGAVDLSALHGVVASPGYCALCSSMLGAVCTAFVTVCAVTSLHLLRCDVVIAVTSLVYCGAV